MGGYCVEIRFDLTHDAFRYNNRYHNKTEIPSASQIAIYVSSEEAELLDWKAE